MAQWALGSAELMLGRYERARDLCQRCAALARESAFRKGIGISLHWLGQAMLVEEAYAEALELFHESVAICREIAQRDTLGCALVGLGSAARGLGDLPEARRHLREALEIGSETGSFPTLMLALPATALVLAEQGEEERAVELYALASRYPFVANSRWFEDVAGKHIAAAAEKLSPQVVAAAQERGRARDLEATLTELLAKLEPDRPS
jgi:tetratricopeptide (TPR) repeat protein